MTRKKFRDLRPGEQFRFDYEPEGVVRTAQQIGKTEIYCPRDGDNTMGHSKAGGEEVYLKSDKEVIMIMELMTEVKVAFKNIPPQVAIMFEVAFKQAATHAFGAPVEIPADGLTIDFAEIEDQQMGADLIQAANVFIMAHSWMALKKRQSEKQPD